MYDCRCVGLRRGGEGGVVEQVPYAAGRRRYASPISMAFINEVIGPSQIALNHILGHPGPSPRTPRSSGVSGLGRSHHLDGQSLLQSHTGGRPRKLTPFSASYRHPAAISSKPSTSQVPTRPFAVHHAIHTDPAAFRMRPDSLLVHTCLVRLINRSGGRVP